VIRDYLTQAEIDTIRTKEMPGTSLNNIRNIFVFSCYTGLAYADVRKLHWGEIVTGFDGNLWIRTNRAKTTTTVQVPLLPIAAGMLPDNNSEGKPCTVFFVPSNQKVNEGLKDIAKMCGIRKKLSFHIARHSFATTITLSNGVPIETLSKMLGHTNIKTTQIYGKIVDHKISEDMCLLKERLNRK
jgi:integrase